jgi:hypothetical protein
MSVQKKIGESPAEVIQAKPRNSQLAARRELRPRFIDSAQAYSIDESCAALDISRAGFYNLIAAKKLHTVNFDGRPRVPGSEIIRLTTPAIASDKAARTATTVPQ